MNKKVLLAPCILCIIFLFSCTGQHNAFIPDPDFSVFAIDRTIHIDNIIETKDGASANNMPLWLLSFVNAGVKAVEQIDNFNNKYVFIAVNEGNNFITLNKWADNFSASKDSAIMIAARIEERMILTASLYPDNEYGMFYETFMKNAFGTEFVNVIKEDTYWFRRSNTPNAYSFFILLTIERNMMQTVIRSMMSQANTTSNNSSPGLTNSQAASVNRLRQTFFEGF